MSTVLDSKTWHNVQDGQQMKVEKMDDDPKIPPKESFRRILRWFSHSPRVNYKDMGAWSRQYDVCPERAIWGMWTARGG